LRWDVFQDGGSRQTGCIGRPRSYSFSQQRQRLVREMYSRIDEKDGEVCCEPNIYTDLECSVRRQSKVEEQEGTLYDPVHKVIVDFLDE
jgi:hypothetical protein